MNAFTDMLQNAGFLLGFASTGIAYAYIGSILASLLCCFYGLILWGREWGSALVFRWKKRRPVRPVRKARRLRRWRWR
jgi:TM2 domain-containing membrane protein YozV